MANQISFSILKPARHNSDFKSADHFVPNTRNPGGKMEKISFLCVDRLTQGNDAEL